MMRPLHKLTLLVLLLALLDASLLYRSGANVVNQEGRRVINVTVAALGLTDLCVATEARYTRHPAVSDSMVPFMDHPGAIEHFPTGSFWTPLSRGNGRVKSAYIQ